MEVNPLPAPLAVAAAGPLRVELRLGSGQCYAKGCEPGEKQLNEEQRVIWVLPN